MEIRGGCEKIAPVSESSDIVLTIGTIIFVLISGDKFSGTTTARDDGSTWVVRFVYSR